MLATEFEAQDTLRLIEISAYPHIKPENQRKMHRRYHSQAFPAVYETSSEPLKLSQFAEKIGKALHGG